MIAGKGQRPGMSVIEQMAKKHHEMRSILQWKQLSKGDQKRKMDAMEAAVGVIPNEFTLKSGGSPSTVPSEQTRDGLIAQHHEMEASDG